MSVEGLSCPFDKGESVQPLSARVWTVPRKGVAGGFRNISVACTQSIITLCQIQPIVSFGLKRVNSVLIYG